MAADGRVRRASASRALEVPPEALNGSVRRCAGRIGAWAWLALGSAWSSTSGGVATRSGRRSTALGLSLYSVTGAASEPLDCDEAIYAYIGKRIAGGSVLYRDLTENKPPGGYWTYALTVALGCELRRRFD